MKNPIKLTSQVKSLDVSGKIIYYFVKLYSFTTMNKVEFMQLWDTYNGLLTPTQQEITNLYFNLDLTVSEIAAEKGVSRQAVSDCLTGCKKQLEEYEQKLHVLELTAELQQLKDLLNR